MKRTIYIITTFLLLVMGIIMIYSSSSVWALYKVGNDKYYLFRQLVFAFLGIVIYFISYSINYNYWKKIIDYVFFISLLLLIIVLIPGIGVVKNGARSWIGFNDISFQPSEFMKISYVLFLAKHLSKDNTKLLKYILLTIIIFGLILLQPDFGTGVIFLITIAFMMYISLLKYKYIIIGGGLLIFGFVVMIMMAPYRLERIFSFLNPWNDPLGSGFQIIQSLYAISPASLFGYGLFKSRQKYFYLPEPQNDFIFAILCEELGIIGGFFVIFLFFVLIYIGYNLLFHIKDMYALYVIFGFTTLIAIQVFINISVVIGLIPVTGVTLPFISYGGSSLLITMFMMGVNTNILKNVKKEARYCLF